MERLSDLSSRSSRVVRIIIAFGTLMLISSPGRYAGSVSQAMRRQEGFIIVFNVLDRQSFENVCRWRQEIERHASNDKHKWMILGNFCERSDATMVMSKEEVAKELDARDGALYFNVSARNDIDVEKAFTALTRLILTEDMEHESRYRSTTVDLSALKPPKDRSLLDRLFGKVRR